MKGNTQQEIAVYLGITRPAYTAYERGTRHPDYEALNRLAIYFDTSIDYMLGSSNTENIHKLLLNLADKMNVSIVELTNNPEDIAAKMLNTTVPILGDINSELPLLHKENCIGEVGVPHGLKADFALIVSGDQMDWAGIYEGDTVIFQENETPPHGAIIAVIENRSGTVNINYYTEENGKKILRAANPLHSDIVIRKHHQIIGQAVKIIIDPPTYQTYQSMILSKNIIEKQLHDVIHKSADAGLSGEKVIKLIEFFIEINQKD